MTLFATDRARPCTLAGPRRTQYVKKKKYSRSLRPYSFIFLANIFGIDLFIRDFVPFYLHSAGGLRCPSTAGSNIIPKPTLPEPMTFNAFLPPRRHTEYKIVTTCNHRVVVVVITASSSLSSHRTARSSHHHIVAAHSRNTIARVRHKYYTRDVAAANGLSTPAAERAPHTRRRWCGPAATATARTTARATRPST